jgi:acyl carrier protein
MTAPVSDDEITATVTEITAAELGVPASSLAPDSNLHEMVGADSVKVVRMIARVEQVYDIELDDEVVFTLRTITSTVRAIRKALGEPS